MFVCFVYSSEYYTAETSVIYYWGGELILSPIRWWLTHYRTDTDALAVGLADVEDDPVALYLGYCDWGTSLES